MEPPLVAAAVCVFPCAFVAGVVAAMADVSADVSTGTWAAVLAVATGAGIPVFAAVCGLPDGVAGAAVGSILSWTDGPVGESGCELAAIAAAARASGAVGPAEEGVVVGTVAAGVDVGIAVATGVGVIDVLAVCWARMVASTAVASPFLSLDLSPSDFDVPDFAVVVPVVDWLFPLVAVLLPLASAGPDGSEFEFDDAPLLLAASFAGGGGGGELLLALALLLALLAGGALSAAGGGDESLLFCAGAGGGGGADADSFGVFWWTRSPKRSFAGDELWRVSQEGAAWNAALAVASWVTLSTGRTPARELVKQSARTGPFLQDIKNQ